MRWRLLEQAAAGRRLAWRLFALFVACALLPLAVSGWLSTSAIEEIATTLDRHSRAAATRRASREILDRLLAAKSLMVAVAAAGEARPAAAPPGLGSSFRRIARLHDDGRLAWSTDAAVDLASLWAQADAGGHAAPPASIADDAPTPSSEAVRISLRTAPGVDGGAPRILLAARRGAAAVVIAELEPGSLWSPMSDANEDAAWLVRDDAGRILARARGADASPEAGLHGAASPAEATMARLFLAAELGAGGWTIEQRAPRAAVLWHDWPLARWLFAVALATVLCIAWVSHWAIRRTLVPLERLTEGTRRLSSGETGTRVEIRRNDEIGSLAVAFNDMASELEAQFSALKGLAAIDAGILSGATIREIVERVVRELAALYPEAAVAVSWRQGDAGLVTIRAGGGPGLGAASALRSGEALLTAPAADRFAALTEAVGDAAPAGDAQAGDALAWLPDSLPGRSDVLVVLPLRDADRAEAAMALRLPGPIPADGLQAARDLRDRLAVALVARRREQALVHRAVHDSLTGLANSDGLQQALDRLLAAAAPAPLAVLFIDLDHFKLVNDTHGHEAGDELLRLTGQRLRGCVPEGSVLARQGGDEFVVVLQDSTQARACTIAAGIVDALGRPFQLRGSEQFCGGSVGIALSPDHGQARDELLRCADFALYAAKAAGRGRHALFSPALDQAARERTATLAALRHAVARNEFVVHYQPRRSVADGVIRSAEALIRWQHPERGLLYPGHFIEIAESSGLICPIGAWILDAVCARIADWRRRGVLLERVSVNVSARQLASGQLPGEVRAALERHGVSPQWLELEVTESLLAGDVDHASAQLSTLRRLGVRIAMDDFGTGYSSMALLRKLPIDVMKVDRAFVMDLETDDGAVAVARSIVALAKALSLHLVAEGVETEAQARLLGEMGCDEFQGYLYSKPVPPEQLLRLPGIPWRMPAESPDALPSAAAASA